MHPKQHKITSRKLEGLMEGSSKRTWKGHKDWMTKSHILPFLFLNAQQRQLPTPNPAFLLLPKDSALSSYLFCAFFPSSFEPFLIYIYFVSLSFSTSSAHPLTWTAHRRGLGVKQHQHTSFWKVMETSHLQKLYPSSYVPVIHSLSKQK